MSLDQAISELEALRHLDFSRAEALQKRIRDVEQAFTRLAVPSFSMTPGADDEYWLTWDRQTRRVAIAGHDVVEKPFPEQPVAVRLDFDEHDLELLVRRGAALVKDGVP